MKKIVSLLIIILMVIFSFAAPPKNKQKKKNKKKNPIELEEIVVQSKNPLTNYKPSKTSLFDLIHTKLAVEPIIKNQTVEGKATITLKPHFYNQNELILDAKFMEIHDIGIKKNGLLIPLSYSYDTMQIKIILDKTYSKNDTIKIVIDYTAQPYKIDDKTLSEYGRGMYFINPLNKNPYKPFHMWSQGEEEASSIWFPTIEATNQKTTQEILVKLDTAYLSLSNGILVSSTNNGDGTKIDYWKQDLPHAPYLFFLGIGDYVKVNDEPWHNKPINYYTFKAFENTAKPVFGNTKAMIEFFSNKLGVPFPWDKYSQILAYDYTAGAMENSSAVIFYDKLLITPDQIEDRSFDWIIAHELFHQWFGDLVTAESWANLTLNESFADYSEYLWAEHFYGKEYADGYNMESFEKYLMSSTRKNEALFNPYYDSPHDVFDAIRYEKGGRILHMLRNYIGDEAFF
ncbi:MAG: M1 family metallopeptidase [Chitinophagales bacterium]